MNRINTCLNLKINSKLYSHRNKDGNDGGSSIRWGSSVICLLLITVLFSSCFISVFNNNAISTFTLADPQVEYKVGWNVGSGGVLVDPSVTGLTGLVLTDDNLIPAGVPTRTGYRFDGWALTMGIKSGGGYEVLSPFVLVDASNTVGDLLSLFSRSDLDTLMFVAQWTRVYSVSVGDSFAEVSGAGEYAVEEPVIVDAGSRAGYVFDGWTVTPSNVVLADASAVSTTFTMPGVNVVVTAEWSQSEYTVTYAPGAHGLFAAQVTGDLHYGDSTPAAPTVTGEAGWTFNGWSPALSATVTDTAVYTAQWTQTSQPPDPDYSPSVSPSPSPSVSPSPSPSVSPSPSPSVSPSPTVSVTAVPSASVSASPFPSASPMGPRDLPVDDQEWAVVNSLICVIGVVLAVLAAVFVLLLGGRRDGQKLGQNGLKWLVVVVVLAIVGVVVFLLTENLGLPFGWIVDKWAILNAAILAAEGIAIWLCVKTVKQTRQ